MTVYIEEISSITQIVSAQKKDKNSSWPRPLDLAIIIKPALNDLSLWICLSAYTGFISLAWLGIYILPLILPT